jgi:hypothetical protein
MKNKKQLDYLNNQVALSNGKEYFNMNIDPTQFKEISDFIPQSSKELLLNPSFNAICQGLGGIFYLIFQKPIKLGIIKKAEFAALTKETAAKLQNIPEGNRDSTHFGLTLKPIEESKYQLNEKMLRQMFANLIASTVDNRKNSKITPRYATALSQLGRADAQFLELLHSQNTYHLPFSLLRLEGKNGSYINISPNIARTNQKKTLQLDMATINTLQSLGIVEFKIGTWLAAEFYESDYRYLNNYLLVNYQEAIAHKRDDQKPSIEKGQVFATEFGSQLFNYIF